MPGIVGIITKAKRESAEPQLRTMIKAMCHEAFYETGLWINEELGVYAGWIGRKGAFPGALPILNARRDKVLIFSGEEYSGPDFTSAPETGREGLKEWRGAYLADLADSDEAFPKCLNGRFQGILTDISAGTSALFNDRYGMARLYFHESPDAFYFAAEAKAILAVVPRLRAMDPRGMAELVSCGCVLENRSVFKEINVLPAGSVWRFRHGAIDEKSVYFHPNEWEEQSTLDIESYYQQLRAVFSRSVPKYFGGHEPVAVSLTGGLDSRMIMSWLRAQPKSVPCFSFGGMYRDCQDVTLARKVAEACDQSHQVIPLGREFLSKFAHYSARTVFLTDGCVDVSHSPDLYINEIARQIAPVRMTGNYGGEVLRSIRAFKPVDPPPGLFQPDITIRLQEARQTYANLVSVHPLSFSVFRQAPWHHYGLQALEQTQLALRSPYLDNDFVQTVFRAPKSTLSSNDVSLRLIHDGNPALRKIRTDRGLAGDAWGWASAVRREFLEFTFKAEYAYDYGMPHWVARADHMLSGMHLEKLFLGRHKFYHFRVWYRDALANYVREVLLDPATLSRPYLDRQGVERIVTGHLKGHRNYTTAIHKLLTLEHLNRSLVETR